MEYTKRITKKHLYHQFTFEYIFALALGQIACGFALGISGTAFPKQPIISILPTFGLA